MLRPTSSVSSKIIGFSFSIVYLFNNIIPSTQWDYHDNYGRYYQHHSPTPYAPFREGTKNYNFATYEQFQPYKPTCQCIKLRNCIPFLEIIRKSSNPISPSLLESLRAKICGYEGSDVKVCCPVFDQRYRRDNFHRDVTTEKPWIWDIEDTTTPMPSYNNVNLNSRFGSDERSEFFNFLQPQRTDFGDVDSNFNVYHRKNFKSKTTKPFRKHQILFHFEDPKTFKNCPPPISNEFELPDDFKNAVPPIQMLHPTTTVVPESITMPNTPPIVSNVNIETAIDRNEKLKLINSEHCGISVNTRIIGGEDAGPGQFPWIARLAYRNKTSGLVSYRCAGTIISDKYVVTASHCVTNLIDDLELILVRIGELDATSSNICSTSGNTLCTESQDFEIESMVHHPDYDMPKYANDIALIRLRRKSNTSFISPLCLPLGEYAEIDSKIVGKDGIIAGWGAMSAGSTTLSPILQWLRIPIVNTSTCAASYAQFSANSRTPIIIGRGQLCVQGHANADACQGDSGGPLMSEGFPGTNRYVLLGIVSFGPRTCGVSNFPGVYTRVSSYINWILDSMDF